MDTSLMLGSWALISLSLFNGLALLWLGLTMFLAAEERRFGLWLILHRHGDGRVILFQPHSYSGGSTGPC